MAGRAGASMMPVRCCLGSHDLAGIVADPVGRTFGARRCLRCHQAIGGVEIEGTPRVLYATHEPDQAPQPVAKYPIWWLRGVHERPSA
jgi:hypothetical protein